MPIGLVVTGRRRPGRIVAAVALALASVAAVGGGASDAEAAATPGFRSNSPTRVLDTRESGGPLGPQQFRRIDLSTIAPAGASAVVVNLTGVTPTEPTFLTAWPGGTTRPTVSNLNLVPGSDRANSAVIGLGAEASIDVFNWAGTVHVVVDVTGWMTNGAFVGLDPSRLLDTRTGSRTPVGPRSSVSVRVAGVGGVPADAAAVAINLTATETSTATFLTAWPGGPNRPPTSNLNLQPADTRANLAVLQVGGDGTVQVYNHSGTSHVVVDVFGYFPDSSTFVGRVPERLLDTRARTCGFRLGPRETRTITVSDAASVGGAALNVTAVSPTDPTFLTVWPTGSRRPLASSLNTDPTVSAAPNTVLTGLGANGQVNIYNHAGFVDVVVDVTGTFTGRRSQGRAPIPCVEGPTPVDGWFGSPWLLQDEQPWIGEDLVAMWTCNASGVRQAVEVDLDELSAMLNVYVAGHYLQESSGRYRPIFVNAGTIALPPGFGIFDCLVAAQERSQTPYTNVLAFDTTQSALFGLAGPGAVVTTNRNPRLPVTSATPSRTDRGVYVSGGNVARDELAGGRDFSLIAHELGHTLAWPHSYSDRAISPWDPSSPDEYDNPFDLMSGAGNQLYGTCLSTPGAGFSTEFCRVPATLVSNRIAAGWVDAASTVSHTSGTRTLELGDAGTPSLTQAVIAPSSRTVGQFLTVQAYTPEYGGFRVDTDGDGVTELNGTVFPTTGVAVHVVETLARGLGRRQYQATKEPDSDRHVLQIGEQLTVDGITIRVESGTDRSFRISVTGTYAGLPD
ncbi:MAG: hypothetical protein ACO225_11345 [Ilumatobacteraceae bacterium]